MNYEQIVALPARYNSFLYSIHEGPDGKIYNVDRSRQRLLYVRDPATPRFKVGDTVLVKSLGEYGEVVEVKQDTEWGNHQYDVEIFNQGVLNWSYRDENELE